jgi:hypothetical protein
MILLPASVAEEEVKMEWLCVSGSCCEIGACFVLVTTTY